MKVSKKANITSFFLLKGFRKKRNNRIKGETIFSFGGFALSIAILSASLTLLISYQKTLKEGLLGANAHIYIY